MRPATLIFDLDDTLYPPNSGVWQQIGDRIDRYMHTVVNIPLSEVTIIRESLYLQYGTTLRGLQILYNVDPHDYLNFVHDISVEQFLKPSHNLRKALTSLPHRKVIFTNADKAHAQRVIHALGLNDVFDQIIDILDIMPFCKPQPEAFHEALKRIGINDPADCALFEDSAKNILTARSLGIFTIQVGNNGVGTMGDLHIRSLDDLLSIFTPDYSLISRYEQ